MTSRKEQDCLCKECEVEECLIKRRVSSLLPFVDNLQALWIPNPDSRGGAQALGGHTVFALSASARGAVIKVVEGDTVAETWLSSAEMFRTRLICGGIVFIYGVQ